MPYYIYYHRTAVSILARQAQLESDCNCITNYNPPRAETRSPSLVHAGASCMLVAWRLMTEECQFEMACTAH